MKTEIKKKKTPMAKLGAQNPYYGTWLLLSGPSLTVPLTDELQASILKGSLMESGLIILRNFSHSVPAS